MDNRWEVLQLRESKTAGRFVLWLSTDNEILSCPLRIPREFYIHLKKPVDGLFRTDYYSCVKVVKNLPRDAPCTNLHKITVKEDDYQKIQEHFIDITNDTNVNGVYELQVGSFLSF
jgi:DNA polymerase epsilon subunit 1